MQGGYGPLRDGKLERARRGGAGLAEDRDAVAVVVGIRAAIGVLEAIDGSRMRDHLRLQLVETSCEVLVASVFEGSRRRLDRRDGTRTTADGDAVS